ncbi:MFS transporter [Paroceanicella profunda]|uniref:MFS transporter n=1 Tax=Paroceanicella profunda TaxID=2579971 RepID=A0A5B8FYD4_9RHOB|nr:MFS transporter [Paroceanicella profunda]QDL92644.1 MFS transporter [Paroceanicella profunda]
MFVALRHTQYRHYITATIFALHGSWIQRIILGWLAWDLSGRSGFVGLIAFLLFGPAMITGPFFGVWADRVDLRRAALVIQVLITLLTGAVLLTFQAGLLSAPLLAGFALSIGVVNSAYHPVRMAFSPTLVSREDIPNTVAIGSLAFNLARILGPAIGGWLIATGGPLMALTVDFLCYLPLIATLCVLRPEPRRPEPGPAPGVLAALADGVRHAAANRTIRLAILLTGIYSLIGRGVLEILPAIADGVFHQGAAGLGQITAASGLGALCAAAFQMWRSTQATGADIPRSAVLACGAGLVLVLLLGQGEGWGTALAIAALLGATGTMVGIGMQVAIQMGLPDRYRGRVMSLWSLVGIGGSALGALLLGWLVDLMGLEAALTLTATLSLGAMGLLMGLDRRR